MDNKIDISSLCSLYVEVYYENIFLGTATAFIVENKVKEQYLITNRHVVTGRNNIDNKVMDKMGAIPNKLIVQIPEYHKEDDMFIWNQWQINLYKNGKERWLEHPRLKNKMDVIAIKLEKMVSNMCYLIEETNYLCSICDNIKIIGYPFGYKVNKKEGYYGIWISGTIASEPLVNLEVKGIEGELPAFLIDARTREGTSGSPVIYYNRQGLLPMNSGFSIQNEAVRIPIGIYSGRITSDSDLGIVWKWKVLHEIIEQ